MKWTFIFLVGLCAWATGCGPSHTAPAATVAESAANTNSMADSLPTEAQGKLITMKLWLGAEEMTAELALSGREIQTGMMFRTNMDENAGMLFVFSQPHRASFWMKNCPLPLSAAYVDPDGRILEIRELEPFNTNSVVASTDRVQYVIEANRGYFDRKKISSGMRVRTERGTLSQTFFHR
jgi:uncharacterized membrane protein (UPF0127 family)